MKASHTPPRSLRVPDDLWAAAQAEAARRGETVTDAVVRFLRRYSRSRRAPDVSRDQPGEVPQRSDRL